MDPSPSAVSLRSPGAILKDIRTLLGLSRERLARKLGFTADYVYKLECGHRPLLPSHLEDLALLRPNGEHEQARAQEFDRLLAELRASVIEETRKAAGEASEGRPVEAPRNTPSEDSDVSADISTDNVSEHFMSHSEHAAFANETSARLDTLANKLDASGAKLDRTDARIDTVGSKLDLAFGRTENKLDVVNTQLGSLTAKVDGMERRSDGADAKLDRSDLKLDVVHGKLDQANRNISAANRKLERNTRALWAAAIGFLALSLVQCLRTTTPGADLFMHSLFTRFTSTPESPEMGEKQPPEMYVPSEPLPGQKRAPCDAEVGEVALNQGCYAALKNVKPPCGRRLFRSGDTCFRAIAADPEKPVGLNPNLWGQGLP